MTAQVHLSFSSCFAEITLLMVEINRYHHDYIDRLDDGPILNLTSLKPKCLFPALTIQMGHGVRDKETTGQHWISFTHFLQHYDET
jgi:hypothetical protein